jgi:type I restriction enzyme R subunit
VPDRFRLALRKTSAVYKHAVRKKPLKNLAVELLERLLKDEIRSNSRSNLVQEKKYSDRLLEALR